MNKWQKAGILVGFTGATFATAHVINRVIFASSISRHVTLDEDMEFYEWRFGKIAYTKKGTGSPLLLIHDLMPYSSSYEWIKVVDSLAKKHTVYSIDLLGCGHSDRPNITYTTFLYVQMLTDFVKNVIGKRTDVIATGNSVPMTVMTCYSDDSLFNRMIFINPENIGEIARIPRKNSNFIRGLLTSPILGTCVYNSCVSKKKISDVFEKELFADNENISTRFINAYHENAHLGGSKAKCLHTSIACRYTTATISKAVSEINNSMFIIGGECVDGIQDTIRDYAELNSSIESCILNNVKKLPQLENPKSLLKQLALYI